jgi:two-component system chemotaxis sensor kinase CheA
MDELLEQFLIEGRELVAQALADLNILATESANTAAIGSAFRAIHTLKGSVGLFPMGPAERILHQAEDVLERVRKGNGALDAQVVTGLVACIDAVDRWIDEIERDGALASDADQVAEAALASLSNEYAPDERALSAAEPDWVAGLIERAGSKIDVSGGQLVAFRYSPDTDCFFRGEDPLAVVAEVAGLVVLDILPAAGAWPDIDAIEPFACCAIIEGLSTASVETVSSAFRMMPDQIVLQQVEPRRPAEADAIDPRVQATSTLRVDARRLDTLLDGLGEMVIAINAFAPLADRADSIDASLAAHMRVAQADLERAAGDLHARVNAVRLVPLAPMLRRLPRLVRDVASTLDKQVAFTISGETLEVDKQIADGLFEPLLHLIRNAIDHGIEARAAREQCGKAAEGRVALSVARDGDAVLVTLADDGGGIDPEKVRAIALSRGILDTEGAAQMSDAAALRLIFRPGFSTARTVSEVSGRGVGLDAVQVAVERLRGTIDIDSEPGKGTRFLVRLPVNALTTQLLVIKIGEDRYGVPLDQIVETLRIEGSMLFPIGGGSACVLRGRTIPVLSLGCLLGGADSSATTAKLLVTRASGERVALKVDGFAERIDALVRPSSGLLANLPGVAGSTLTGDGDVLLILDLPALVA